MALCKSKHTEILLVAIIDRVKEWWLMNILYSINVQSIRIKKAYVNDFPRNTIGGAMAANMQKIMWSCAQPKIHKIIKPGL